MPFSIKLYAMSSENVLSIFTLSLSNQKPQLIHAYLHDLLKFVRNLELTSSEKTGKQLGGGGGVR